MKILTIKTDQPTAEICVFDDNSRLGREVWQAHRELSATILQKILKLTKACVKDLKNIEAIVVFEGTGSFTGLRIGTAVANSLAYGLKVPIVSSSGDNWQKTGINKLLAGKDQKVVNPRYGSPANITKPKK